MLFVLLILGLDLVSISAFNLFRQQPSDDWWYGVGGNADRANSDPYYATMRQMDAQLDLHTPFFLHRGQIDRGQFLYPGLQKSGDRSFGLNPDFNPGDLRYFRFKPQGQRFPVQPQGGVHIVNPGDSLLGYSISSAANLQNFDGNFGERVMQAAGGIQQRVNPGAYRMEWVSQNSVVMTNVETGIRVAVRVPTDGSGVNSAMSMATPWATPALLTSGSLDSVGSHLLNSNRRFQGIGTGANLRAGTVYGINDMGTPNINYGQYDNTNRNLHFPSAPIISQSSTTNPSSSSTSTTTGTNDNNGGLL